MQQSKGEGRTIYCNEKLVTYSSYCSKHKILSNGSEVEYNSRRSVARCIYTNKVTLLHLIALLHL